MTARWGSPGDPTEAYVSVDIEAAGPVPGEYSMLALGACLVDSPQNTFYAELQPINERFVPEALEVSKLSLQRLKREGRPPSAAMTDFGEWVKRLTVGRQPVFVGFNACFDWSFVNWYFHVFVGDNPFGFGGVDIKAYIMGMTGCTWQETRMGQLPAEFKPSQPLSHNALDDAIQQAEIFTRILAAGTHERAKR